MTNQTNSIISRPSRRPSDRFDRCFGRLTSGQTFSLVKSRLTGMSLRLGRPPVSHFEIASFRLERLGTCANAAPLVRWALPLARVSNRSKVELVKDGIVGGRPAAAGCGPPAPCIGYSRSEGIPACGVRSRGSRKAFGIRMTCIRMSGRTRMHGTNGTGSLARAPGVASCASHPLASHPRRHFPRDRIPRRHIPGVTSPGVTTPCGASSAARISRRVQRGLVGVPIGRRQ